MLIAWKKKIIATVTTTILFRTRSIVSEMIKNWSSTPWKFIFAWNEPFVVVRVARLGLFDCANGRRNVYNKLSRSSAT